MLLRDPLPEVGVLVDALRKTIKFEDKQTVLLNLGQKHTPAAQQALDADDQSEDGSGQDASGSGGWGANTGSPVDDETSLSEADKIKRKYNKMFGRGAEEDETPYNSYWCAL